jgi:hypothetical protein
MTATPPAERAADAERLADLLERRADVHNERRERNPYYGDDDIDLLRSIITRLEQERDTALREAEGRLSAYLVASKQLAESQREVEALREEVGRTQVTRDEAVVVAARKLGDAMNNCQSCDAEFQELWDALATRDAAL